jgi:NitT/TauT family transport system substrate-binding protein
LILTIAVAAITAFLVWQSVERPADELKGDTPLRLQLQWSAQAQFAGYFVAKDQGFYRAQKLSVDIIPGGFATSPINSVISGNADVGSATGDQVLLGRYNLNPIVAVGVVFPQSIAGFMSKTERNIHQPKDLRGKKIGYYAGFDTENLLLTLLTKEHFDSRDVSITPVTNIQAFDSGTVDLFPVYSINEPLEMDRRGISVSVLSPEQFGIHFYSDTLFTTEVFLRRNREAVRGFLDATAQGWNYARSHQEETVTLLLKENSGLSDTPESRAHQLDMLRATLNQIPAGNDRRIFRMDMNRWEEMRDSLRLIGRITNPRTDLLTRLCDRIMIDE